MGRSIGIGQLGYGGIGKVHTLAYRSISYYYPGGLPEIRLAAVCTTKPESAAAAASEGGFARSYTSMKELVADPGVDVVDCSLPNFAHKEAIRLALEAGKHVYCEKPLCVDVSEAREIAGMASRSSSKIGLTFDYRFIPAVTRAKQLIASGALGKVYNFRFVYYHTGYQDESRPLSWRMRKAQSGGGALVDLGAHVVDMARYLLGELSEVLVTTKTFVDRRPISRGAAELGDVDVDDAAWIQAKLADGTVGTIEVSRFTTGALDDLDFHIEGENGALKFGLMDGNFLYYYDATQPAGEYGGDRGWKRLETAATYPGASIPPGRSILGWTRLHAENQYRFLKSIAEGGEPSPNLRDGIAVQLFLDAAYRSAVSGKWEPLPPLSPT